METHEAAQGAAEAGRRLIAGRALRWDLARSDAAYASGLWVRETLAAALARAAAETPDRILITGGDDVLDSRTLHAEAHQLAQAMLAKAPPASTVSFMLPNWREAAVIYLAATLAGMVVNPLLPSLRDRDLGFILRDAKPRLVFVPGAFRNFDYPAMMDRVLEGLGDPPQVVVVRGAPGAHTAYASLPAFDGRRPLPKVDPDAARMVMFTSGTTGTPKGVLHSHNSIHALIRQLGRHWLVEPGDTFLVASPISHIGGSIYAFECPLLLGARAVLMERWDADAAVRLVDAERCTHMAGATPFLEGLLAAAERAGSRLPSLKLFICGGAAVPPALIRRAAAHFERAAVMRVYGSTEVPVTTIGVPDRADIAHAAETDGRPGFAEVKLGGQNGGEGEILARGPQMLVGYHHPEQEADAFDADGFYRTGDLGRWADGDYLVVSGRLKDMIIRNGENISPKEVEDLLLGHPGIAEVAVVGTPDPRTGERACVVIVPAGDAGPGLEDVRAFLRDLGVAAFKIPEQVLIWAALPKNDAGKVLKHQVRAEIAQTEER
jgi:acyl-CoA synthetase (AMP-forming)/AMP-acid ligase II